MHKRFATTILKENAEDAERATRKTSRQLAERGAAIAAASKKYYEVNVPDEDEEDEDEWEEEEEKQEEQN